MVAKKKKIITNRPKQYNNILLSVIHDINANIEFLS